MRFVSFVSGGKPTWGLVSGDGVIDLGARGLEPGTATGELRIVTREFYAEGRRLCVDAVAATNAHIVFMLVSAPLQRSQQRIHVREQEISRLGELDR